MTWGHLSLLWGLLVVPVLVVAYALEGQRRKRLRERIGHLPMIARMTANFSPARRRWREVLLVIAVALLVTALARPQIPGRAKLTESRGLDLVVALDFSRSMLARDIYPTRLERAKSELVRFFDDLHGDRVGLVAFAGETMSYPLTVDYEAAKLFWRDLMPDDMPVGGTDLGRAIDAASALLSQARAREGKRHPAQLILLFTDGEDTEGNGLAAARRAARQGIKVFTLGIGSDERPPVPLYDADGRQRGYVVDDKGNPVRVGLDEAALKQIASITGGDYVGLDPQRFGVEHIQKAIAGLERTQEAARFQREPNDIGRWFLLPAFLLLVVVTCGRERRRRRAMPVEETAATAGAERVLAAGLLLFTLPFLTGFDALKRKDPNIEAGNRLLAAGKAAEALKAYDRAVTALPDEPIAHFDRGAALYQLKRYPEAQREFMRASEGHDAGLKADAYYNMGNALLAQDRYQEAFDAYRHTLGLRPDDRRAKWNLELALRKLEEQKQKNHQQQKSAQQQKQSAQQPKSAQQQDQERSRQDQEHPGQSPQDQKRESGRSQAGQPAQRGESRQPQPDQAAQGQKEPPAASQGAAKSVAHEPPREIDRQDAEAVLDALERVEPTVQKDLARQRAGTRRPTKDW